MTATPHAAPAVRGVPEVLRLEAVDAARALVGWSLTLAGCGGEIVETEAYRQDDPASHSRRGPRGRAAPMFGPPGTIYVYRSYGIHWCLNLVCGAEGRGEAVLIRALAPREGLDAMRARRPSAAARDLCRGPGRLCAALGVEGSLTGRHLAEAGMPLTLAPPAGDPPPIVAGPRIGISRAVERPWRFGRAGSSHLSRPFPTGVPA